MYLTLILFCLVNADISSPVNYHQHMKQISLIYSYPTTNGALITKQSIDRSSFITKPIPSLSNIKGRLLGIQYERISKQNNVTIKNGKRFNCNKIITTNNSPWLAVLFKNGYCPLQKQIDIVISHTNASAIVVVDNTQKLRPIKFTSHQIAIRIDSLPFDKDIIYNDSLYVNMTLSYNKLLIDGLISRTSVLLVSIAFILFMIISFVWLTFYYIQRFRYMHAKERLSRRLANAAKKALNKIPIKLLVPEDAEVENDVDQCAICIDCYRAGETIRILPCKHIFHKMCIDSWLIEQRSCPMCKLDILKECGFIVGMSGVLHSAVPSIIDESSSQHDEQDDEDDADRRRGIYDSNEDGIRYYMDDNFDNTAERRVAINPTGLMDRLLLSGHTSFLQRYRERQRNRMQNQCPRRHHHHHHHLHYVHHHHVANDDGTDPDKMSQRKQKSRKLLPEGRDKIKEDELMWDNGRLNDQRNQSRFMPSSLRISIPEPEKQNSVSVELFQKSPHLNSSVTSNTDHTEYMYNTELASPRQQTPEIIECSSTSTDSKHIVTVTNDNHSGNHANQISLATEEISIHKHLPINKKKPETQNVLSTTSSLSSFSMHSSSSPSICSCNCEICEYRDTETVNHKRDKKTWRPYVNCSTNNRRRNRSRSAAYHSQFLHQNLMPRLLYYCCLFSATRSTQNTVLNQSQSRTNQNTIQSTNNQLQNNKECNNQQFDKTKNLQHIVLTNKTQPSITNVPHYPGCTTNSRNHHRYRYHRPHSHQLLYHHYHHHIHHLHHNDAAIPNWKQLEYDSNETKDNNDTAKTDNTDSKTAICVSTVTNDKLDASVKHMRNSESFSDQSSTLNTSDQLENRTNQNTTSDRTNNPSISNDQDESNKDVSKIPVPLPFQPSVLPIIDDSTMNTNKSSLSEDDFFVDYDLEMMDNDGNTSSSLDYNHSGKVKKSCSGSGHYEEKGNQRYRLKVLPPQVQYHHAAITNSSSDDSSHSLDKNHKIEILDTDKVG